ncbi:MAG TPA: glutaminyl-peptide cyclotransferase [Longimicrobiaceae bacterium]|nr:glutaminyl-peptide cyclotransferase [Longimicrobiaceae bacterium]
MRGNVAISTAMALLSLGGCGSDDSSADAAEPPAPVVSVQQVRSYPHDPLAFTQGLVYHEGRLYESTGRYRESSLRRVELETGRVLDRVAVPDQYFAEGVTLFDGRLYQLTWQQGIGFIYDLAALRQESTFPYDGEGWGITTDGASLILSDGSNVLRFIDPATHQLQRGVEVMDGQEHVHDLNELEWVRGEVWANVWHTERIARIDPRTGKVKGWLDLAGVIPTPRPADPEAVLNGIAYDAATDRLFVTGKLWPQLFEISVPGLVGDKSAGQR